MLVNGKPHRPGGGKFKRPSAATLPVASENEEGQSVRSRPADGGQRPEEKKKKVCNEVVQSSQVQVPMQGKLLQRLPSPAPNGKENELPQSSHSEFATNVAGQKGQKEGRATL